jgi:hypothetical protein
MAASEGDRPGGAPNSGTKPTDRPKTFDALAEESEYPELPPHVLERLAGYLGPPLRRRMAMLRDAEHAQAA